MNVLTYEQLKQRLDAVVAENVKAIAAVQTFADATEQLTEIIGDEIGMKGVANLLAAFAAVGNMPETTAALAEVEAKAIEKALGVVTACRENICPGGLSENRQYEESIVQPHLDGIADELENLIVDLREGLV